MDYITSHARGIIARILRENKGATRSRMEFELAAANPFRNDTSLSRSQYYERECRRHIERLYPDGESEETLFSGIEERK
jgi:hypothetical protein